MQACRKWQQSYVTVDSVTEYKASDTMRRSTSFRRFRACLRSFVIYSIGCICACLVPLKPRSPSPRHLSEGAVPIYFPFPSGGCTAWFLVGKSLALFMVMQTCISLMP